MTRHLFSVALLLAVAAATALSQGLYWESTTSGMEPGTPGQRHIASYMPGLFKESDAANHQTTIIRRDRGVIIRVDNDKKTYSEMTFADLEALMKKAGSVMDERMKMMEEKMKDMPEEQRKMVQQMIDQSTHGTAAPKIDLAETGKSKTVSGYPCKEYVVKSNGKELFSLWATSAVSGFAAMQKDLAEFNKQMAAMSPVHGTNIAEAFAKINGFPMETDMGSTSITVTKVEKRSIPASEFEVPAGYTKVKSKLQEEFKGE